MSKGGLLSLTKVCNKCFFKQKIKSKIFLFFEWEISWIEDYHVRTYQRELFLFNTQMTMQLLSRPGIRKGHNEICVMLRTKQWLDYHGLNLTMHKTELFLITGSHIPLQLDMSTLISRFASVIRPEETRRKTKYDFPYVYIDFHLIDSEIHNFS